MIDTISFVLGALGIVLALLSLLYVVYQNKDVDVLVKKRVNEELAPYREFLEAGTQSIKRPHQEIMVSMTRFPEKTDTRGYMVINESTEKKPEA